jgi:virginiamycin A acetyltransferase
MNAESLPYADPSHVYPRKGDRSICYLKSIVKNPAIVVGDFTFYHDFDSPEQFEKHVLYQYPINNDRLIIGKFCSIACGATFILNGANHSLKSLTNYPFPIFGEEWGAGQKVTDAWDNKGDIVIGNDVWLGYQALIMPGVHIGDGSVVGSRTIVTRDVPPYTIVAGAPGRVLRKRYDEATIELLLESKWWDLPVEQIAPIIPLLTSGNVDALRAALACVKQKQAVCGRES